MSKLSDLFKNTTIGYNSFSPLSIGGFSLVPKTQTLPNEGGTIPAVTTTPTPVVPTDTANVKQKSMNQLFNKTTKKTTPAPQEEQLDLSAHINPATGKLYSPQEYADMMATRANAGSIPSYAASAMMLNNERNDIATGATDPYKVASKSGIQYTPAELSAIEKAYAGIYDPVLNDVFAKLDIKKKEDEQKAADIRYKEQQRIATDENIRQYNATTGAQRAKDEAGLNIPKGSDTYVDPDAYIAKAKSAGNIKKFLADNPPELYVNPESYKLLPESWRPKQNAADQDIQNAGLYYSWLAQPGNENVSDVEKAAVLRSMNLDPVKFNLYGV